MFSDIESESYASRSQSKAKNDPVAHKSSAMLPSLPKSAVSFDEITSETDGVKKELDGSICENSVSVSLVFFLFLYFILFFTFSLSLFFLIAIAVLIKYLLYTLNKYIQIYFIFIFSLLFWGFLLTEVSLS